jgi:hypothetical protein
MKIKITMLSPPRWEVRDASPLDVQELVKFADRWEGVQIEDQAEIGHYIIEAHNEAQADAFDLRFQDYIVRGLGLRAS